MVGSRPNFDLGDWDDPGSLGSLDAHGLADRLRWALGVAVDLGAEVSSQCRAVKALRHLELLAELNVPGSAAVATAGDSGNAAAHHRVAWELFLIALSAYLAPNANHPFTVPKLSRILSGPISVEGRDRTARNTEFELVVASRLFLGGATVLDGEPDIRFLCESEMLGVAVKRVTSAAARQVRRAIKVAVDQIRRSGLRGHIAISLDAWLERQGLEADAADFLEGVDRVFEIVADSHRYYSHDPHVLGIMITSPLTHMRNERAPNGLPLIDINIPWRFVRYYAPGEEAQGAAFWQKWQETLAHNLRVCASVWPLERLQRASGA